MAIPLNSKQFPSSTIVLFVCLISVIIGYPSAVSGQRKFKSTELNEQQALITANLSTANLSTAIYSYYLQQL